MSLIDDLWRNLVAIRSESSSEPTVTVIIPTYNYAHFIGEAIRSVQAQTYQDWECIVVDDGSSDDTREVVAGYATSDERIRYVHQPNRGLAAARNTGLGLAKGKLIQFLDSDDLIEKEKIEKQVQFLEQHADVDIVYGNTRYFRTEHPEERLYSSWSEDKPWMPEITEGVDALKALVQRVIVVHAPLLRRSVVDDVGLFDESMKACEDWHFWIRCAALGKRFRYLEESGTLALIRWHAQSMSQHDRFMTMNIVGMRKKVNRLIQSKEIRVLNRRLAAEYLGHAGVREIESGHRARGVRRMLGAATMSATMREKLKWLVCALAGPVASKHYVGRIAGIPLRRLISDLLRRPFRRASL
ncbi:MAG TPA: glycosyltransferase [Pyrinomonadaceae bacterium]|nr:glycosyltransferase [Pyrinomonadaceae bacterium]